MWNNELGGGFLSSPGNLGAQSQISPKEKKDRATKSDNVVACTIEHLHCTATEKVMVGSLAVNNVSLLGLVRSVNEQATRITFALDDMTGQPIEVQLWHGDETGDELRSKIVENTYVRVVGNFRHMKDTRVVLAYKVIPVTDMNELTMHILEVIHTGMAIALMDKQVTTFSSSSQIPGPKQQPQHTLAVPGPAKASENTNTDGLDATQRTVLKLILDVSAEEGIHVDQLCEKLPSLSRQAVKKAIDFLSGEGHIYTTVDDDHYKATDSV